MSTVKKLNIGVIGYKNHALRLINEFYKSKKEEAEIPFRGLLWVPERDFGSLATGSSAANERSLREKGK